MQNRANPFIGFEGIGSRIIAKNGPHGLTLKEATSSQLIKIFGLLIFGLGLTILFFVEREKFLKHSWPILFICGIFSSVGWIFGLKFLYQFLIGRRIEISAMDGAILLIRGGNSVDCRIERSSIIELEVVSTWFHSEGSWTENFTLRVSCNGGKVIDLCTSNRRSDVDSIKSTVESLIN